MEFSDLSQLLDKLQDDHLEGGELHLLRLAVQVLGLKAEELVQHGAGDHERVPIAALECTPRLINIHEDCQIYTLWRTAI